MKSGRIVKILPLFQAVNGNRTRDLLTTNAVRYRLCHISIYKKAFQLTEAYCIKAFRVCQIAFQCFHSSYGTSCNCKLTLGIQCCTAALLNCVCRIFYASNPDLFSLAKCAVLHYGFCFLWRQGQAGIGWRYECVPFRNPG